MSSTSFSTSEPNLPVGEAEHASGPGRPLGLYVHIPFCETKCPYCDFNTYAQIESLMPSYVAALVTEVEILGDRLGRPGVGTVFFGGGTPSYLPAAEIGKVIEAVRAAFEVTPDAEVTLEANPDDLTASKLAVYRELGVNRLSIGVQSLDDKLLTLIGRRHSASEAIGAYRSAVEAGFQNVSIDLMYGLPHQTIADWQDTLVEAAELDPPHFSMYCLTLEGGTPMEQSVKSGRLPKPDSDLAADMYVLAEEHLSGLGYRHYEISNWATPGFEGQHHLTYWRNQPYLGVGPGAHSYLQAHRFSNLKSPREYIRRLADGVEPPRISGGLNPDSIGAVPVVDMVDPIDRRTEMAETMMLGLRLDTGVGMSDFAARFGIAPTQVYGDIIAELDSVGLLEAVDGSLRLTARGRLLGNEVFSRFFL